MASVPEISSRPAAIESARLRLIVLLPQEMEALIGGDTARASQLTGATFPAGWPEAIDVREGLPWHMMHLMADPAQQAWRVRVIVERDTNLVVGGISLKGPPDTLGDVEIGWGVNADRRRRGYAFEAAVAVMRWAAGQPGVRQFSATIPKDNVASQALARKLGMRSGGEFRGNLQLWVLQLD